MWRWRGQKLVRDDLHRFNKKHNTTVHPDVYVRRWGGFSNFVKLFSQYKLEQITFSELLEAKKVEKLRDPITPRIRAEILNRDQYRCVDCGASPRTDPNVQLHIHHVIPVSAGGKTEPKNLVTNCADCNLGKSDVIDSA